MKTLLLIDGNAVMHRAYHAIPPFKTKTGQITNVLYGFISILHKAVEDFNPTHLIICFDLPAPTFRKKMFSDYKATRKKIDDDFKIQIPLVKESLVAAKIAYREMEGYEADDLIGSAAHEFRRLVDKILILSGDKDILQLVNDKVFVITPHIGFAKTKIYDRQKIYEQFNLTPKQMIDYKALAGDQSDNYAGAKGIGPKTASQLINQFGNVENLFKKIKQVKSEKTKEMLIRSKEDIVLAKKLAEIDENLNLDIKLEQAEYHGFKEPLREFLLRYEMFALTNRLFKNKKNVVPKKTSSSTPQLGLF
jgi:DNA polymerase-1